MNCTTSNDLDLRDSTIRWSDFLLACDLNCTADPRTKTVSGVTKTVGRIGKLKANLRRHGDVMCCGRTWNEQKKKEERM